MLVPSWFWISGTLPDPVLGEVEWLYEFDEYPGDLEPVKDRLGAAREVVRTDGAVIEKGFAGGTMVGGDSPIEFGGVVGMLCVEELALP